MFVSCGTVTLLSTLLLLSTHHLPRLLLRPPLTTICNEQICHILTISKCRGDWDPGQCSFWVSAAKRKLLRNAKFRFLLRAKRVFFGSRHCTAVLFYQVERGECILAIFEHPMSHINRHTHIHRTDMGKFLGDRARSGQRPPGAFCLSLLFLLHHSDHTTIGTVQSVDFAHSAYKMATSLPHMLRIKQYHSFWCFLGKRSNNVHF